MGDELKIPFADDDDELFAENSTQKPQAKPEPKRWPGQWVVDECERGDPEYSQGDWIEFHCSKCGTGFGLEAGQYDWCYYEPIPYLYCPICGDCKKKQHDRHQAALDKYWDSFTDYGKDMDNEHESD